MIKFGLSQIALLAAFALGFPVPAAEVLRDSRGLQGWNGGHAEAEVMLRLGQAKIAHLNHRLLRRDFPSLKNLTDAQVEEAVLNCAGYISRANGRSTTVNTEPALSPDRPSKPAQTSAYRPLGYGRAVVFPCFWGLIDMKGSGAKNSPAQDEYKTGLFSLAKALREEMMERTVALILEHEGYPWGTVETYGQIDLGFDVVLPSGEKIPAGGVLRQAHKRDNPVGISGQRGNAIEAILRKYGMTSSHRLGEMTWQLISDHNAQMDANGAVFDFETIYRYPKFSNSPVNPDPQLELPLKVWDEFSSVQPWAARLAKDIRAGKISGAGVESEMQKWLKPLRDRLKACPAALKPGVVK